MAKFEVTTEHGNGSIKCGRYVLRLTKERLQRGTPSSPPVSAPQGANKRHSPAYGAHSSSGENQVELPVRRFGKMEFETVGSGKELWIDPQQERFLLHLLSETVKDNISARRNTVWTKQTWTRFAEQMSKQFGILYSWRQVQDKYTRLRITYNAFKNLKDVSGHGWDDEVKRLIAPEEYWLTAPKAQLQFRKRGLPNYDELSFIFNHCKATGTMSFTSTQAPPTSDEENEMEAEQRNHGLGADHPYAPNMASMEGILANKHHSSGKRRHGDSGGQSSKKSKLVDGGIDRVLQLLSETSVVRNEVEQRRLNHIMHKEKGKGVVEIEDDDPYHPAIAQDQMLKLKAHLKGGQYSAGIAKLSDPIWRRSFIRSPPEFQLAMLQSLCPVNPQPPRFHGQYPPYPYPYPTWPSPFPPHLSSQNAAPFPYQFPSVNQPTFPPSYLAQSPTSFPNNWGNLQHLPVAGPTRLPFTKPF